MYMKLALGGNSDDGLGMKIFCFITLALWARQVYIEISQMRSEGAGYFCQFFNMVDVTGLILVLFILVIIGLGLDFVSNEALRVIAAFATCFTMLKFFDWLRLFEDTAFYVLLV